MVNVCSYKFVFLRDLVFGIDGNDGSWWFDKDMDLWNVRVFRT